MCVCIYIYIYTPWIIESEGSLPHLQGSTNNSYLGQNRIDTDLFIKSSFNIVLPCMLCLGLLRGIFIL